MRVIKKKGELSASVALEELSDTTRNFLIHNKTKVQKGTNENLKKKYSRKNPKAIYSFVNGFDLLQYSIVVKPYIYKRYNIKSPIELDALLYLFPIQFFCMEDFKYIPLKQENIHLKTMIDMGYLELCVKNVDNARNIYTLTDHAINIVKDYYRYLSGEKTIIPGSYKNPFRGKDAKKVDQLRERVMMRLKSQAESNPSKFRENLY